MQPGALSLPPGALSGLTPPNLMDQAREQYPVLKNLDYGYSENFRPNGGFLEHWDPGEPGAPSSPEKPLDGMRPEGLPIDKHGLEVRDPNTRPIDILGDIVSHNLINTDPTVSASYQKLQDTMTPQQHAILADQYAYAQKNQGEQRPFEDWKSASGMPGYFRGYTFKQWPDDFNAKAYTPEQRADLDKLMSYFKTGHQ